MGKPSFTIKKVRSLKYLKALEAQNARALGLLLFQQNLRYQIRQYFQSLLLNFSAYGLIFILAFCPFFYYHPISVSAAGAETLTIINNVTDTYGGTAGPGDFTATVTGNNVSSPTFATANGSGTVVNLDVGSYSVFLNGPTGYNSSYSSGCYGTINPGDSDTCTITSQDEPADLNIITNVDNSSGGTNQPSDFIFSVTATNPNPASAPGTSSGNLVTLNPGPYSVAETSLAGYHQTLSGDCSGTLAAGQVKSCIITNTYSTSSSGPTAASGTLTVINNVINSYGGGATSTDFTATVTGTGPTPASFPTTAGGTVVSLQPGSYSVFLNGPTGYNSSYSSGCYGNINAGDSDTCTITSTDQPSGIEVVTNVVNTASGTATSSDFVFTVTGTNPSPASASGTPSGVLVTLAPGGYSVNEPVLDGYSQTLSPDCSGTLISGQVKFCTITNSDESAAPVISNELAVDVTGSSVTITWTTDHPATSRVVYGITSNSTLGAAPNYGYADSTIEDSTLVTGHSVIVTGLSAGTTYYLRPVSHGSPEAAGDEISATTDSAGTPSGGGDGAGGGSSGGGGGSSVVVGIGGSGITSNASSSTFQGLAFQPTGEVLGASTDVPSVAVNNTAALPKTGMPPSSLFLLMLAALGVGTIRYKYQKV